MSEPFVTPEAVLKYPHLWEAQRPRQYPDSKKKFSCQLLLFKNDPAVQALVEMYQAEIFNKYGEARPYEFTDSLIDGALKKPGDPYYADKWILSTSRQEIDGPPEVKLDANTPVINQADIYSGVIARGIVHFFPYVNINGIGCDLHAIMKVRDGEKLGNQTTVNSAAAFAQYQGAGPTQPKPAAPAGFGVAPPDPNHNF